MDQDRAEEGTTRNDTIRIGSKTLAQIRKDFPILKELIHWEATADNDP